jgi:Cu-Zn family superoxide dismutase
MQTMALSAALSLALVLPVLAQEEASASASFVNAEGLEIGTATLTQGENGVSIIGELTGVAPGEHGFHFHQVGDCDPASQFESAGPHFNPTEHKHGIESPDGPHAGDLPNVEATDAGVVLLDLSSEAVSLTEGEEAYVFDEDGTALVLHADADDNVTDPSGNSGDRIACGVIEAVARP